MTKIWAHRGASADAPENTLPAFALAVDQGADGIELDVQRTADGELVVIHDELVNRTSDGSGRVADLTLEQLRRLNFNNGMTRYGDVQIPTLQEVLEFVEETWLTVNIELKNTIDLYPGMEAELVAMVAEFGLSRRVTYSSFNHYSLLTLKEGPSLVGALYSDGMVDPWVYANYLGVDAVHPPWEVLQVPGVVYECHANGLRVHPWIVPTSEVPRLAGLRVDAIITDHPAQARRLLPRR